MQAIQEKKYLQFLFDLVFICKYSQEMKKLCIQIFAFLVSIFTLLQRVIKVLFWPSNKVFISLQILRKFVTFFIFTLFGLTFIWCLKKDFWPPLSLQCPRAVCRINAINACIVYICTSVFQFSNCRIFCFFLQAIYSRVARVCKKDHGGSFKFAHRWTTFLKAR